jgi:hypothetical protein
MKSDNGPDGHGVRSYNRNGGVEIDRHVIASTSRERPKIQKSNLGRAIGARL